MSEKEIQTQHIDASNGNTQDIAEEVISPEPVEQLSNAAENLSNTIEENNTVNSTTQRIIRTHDEEIMPVDEILQEEDDYPIIDKTIPIDMPESSLHSYSRYSGRYGKEPVPDSKCYMTEDYQYEPTIYDQAFEDNYSNTSIYDYQNPYDQHSYGADEDGTGIKAKKKKMSFVPKLIIGIILTIIVALGIGYGIGVFYYSNHLLPNTYIDGVDIGGMTRDEANNTAGETVSKWNLTIHDTNKDEDIVIHPEDISLTPETFDAQTLLDSQNEWAWITSLYKENGKTNRPISYDETALQNYINGLDCVSGEGRTDSKNAEIQYDESSKTYQVVSEAIGDRADGNKIFEKSKELINGTEPVEIDLLSDNCYILPEFTSESPEIRSAQSELNKMLGTTITLTIDDIENAETINADQISKWILLDDKMQVVFDTESITQYLREIGEKYDTIGTERQLTTPKGETVSVSGGTYGWSVDEETELTQLQNDIRTGEDINREITYVTRAAGPKDKDYGSVYVEVDISDQHVYFVENGQVLFDCDVVTGTPDGKHDTVEGIWSILEKDPNKVLVGEIVPSTGKPEYETPVLYWQRFTWQGHGFHQLNRSAYGGNIYTYNGSHGCVNMSTETAEQLYELTEVGMPVIVHQ